MSRRRRHGCLMLYFCYGCRLHLPAECTYQNWLLIIYCRTAMPRELLIRYAIYFSLGLSTADSAAPMMPILGVLGTVLCLWIYGTENLTPALIFISLPDLRRRNFFLSFEIAAAFLSWGFFPFAQQSTYRSAIYVISPLMISLHTPHSPHGLNIFALSASPIL